MGTDGSPATAKANSLVDGHPEISGPGHPGCCSTMGLYILIKNDHLHLQPSNKYMMENENTKNLKHTYKRSLFSKP
jgi:hypothetical protein